MEIEIGSLSVGLNDERAVSEHKSRARFLRHDLVHTKRYILDSLVEDQSVSTMQDDLLVEGIVALFHEVFYVDWLTQAQHNVGENVLVLQCLFERYRRQLRHETVFFEEVYFESLVGNLLVS